MTDQDARESGMGEQDWDGELPPRRAIPDREIEQWRWDGQRLLPSSPRAVAVAQELEAWRRFREWKGKIKGSSGRASAVLPAFLSARKVTFLALFRRSHAEAKAPE